MTLFSISFGPIRKLTIHPQVSTQALPPPLPVTTLPVAAPVRAAPAPATTKATWTVEVKIFFRLVQIQNDTLPIAPENRPKPKRNVVFQPAIFRDFAVSFRREVTVPGPIVRGATVCGATATSADGGL